MQCEWEGCKNEADYRVGDKSVCFEHGFELPGPPIPLEDKQRSNKNERPIQRNETEDVRSNDTELPDTPDNTE